MPAFFVGGYKVLRPATRNPALGATSARLHRLMIRRVPRPSIEDMAQIEKNASEAVRREREEKWR